MPRRSLLPREHGAYFQLAIPLVAAWLADGPHAPGMLLGGAASLAFLAHEPLLVLLGVRGERLRQAAGGRARFRLGLVGGGALALGVAGLALAPPATLAFAAAGFLLGILLIALASRRREHTLQGELVAAAALTGASAIARVAAGTAPAIAVAWWLGWAAGFGATVVGVHRVLARHKASAGPTDRLLGGAGIIATLGLAVMARQQLACLIAAPLFAVSTAIVIAPPHARRLRAVGITISVIAVGAGALAAVA